MKMLASLISGIAICAQLCLISPVEIAFTRKNLKLKFGTMIQDQVTKKKSPCFGHRTCPFLAFNVCHLVSKSFYYSTAYPKVVKVQVLNKNWFLSLGFKKFTLKLMTLLPKFVKK